MKNISFIATLFLLALFLASAEATKKCRCRGKRGKRGFKGPVGPPGPPGPAGSGSSCKLVHESGPSNTVTEQTGSLSFSIPILSVGSTCPDGFSAVSCDCHINTFENGSDQVRTKLIGWGTLARFCLCNYEYLEGFDEKVEVSAQVNCVKLDCS